ncbi:MAG: hypothetical protein NTX76_00670 [Alphaproteobacteria bacterium]|nr:hypothetical protein [Alphaproteobacteria bacterium]
MDNTIHILQPHTPVSYPTNEWARVGTYYKHKKTITAILISTTASALILAGFGGIIAAHIISPQGIESWKQFPWMIVPVWGVLSSALSTLVFYGATAIKKRITNFPLICLFRRNR